MKRSALSLLLSAFLPPSSLLAADTIQIPPADPAAAERPRIYTLELGGKDLRFLTDALEIGSQQLFLCELAETRGQSEQVRGLAGVLKHTQAEENSKLQRLAAMQGLNISAPPATAQKTVAKKFAKLEGAKFDKAWLDEILALNQRAVANCELDLQSSDPEIRAFVQKALPLAKEKLFVVNKMSGNTPAPVFRATPPPVPAAQ